MPQSSASGKAYIADLIKRINPQRVFDVGAGAGHYGQYKQAGQHWTAIEIWQPNIAQFALEQKYDAVVCADARAFAFKRCDLIIFGDVLEHMPAADAQNLLATARALSKYVIVSIPIGHYPQGPYNGNPSEEHITDNWSVEGFVETFGAPWQQHLENEIGVFVYRRLKIAVYAISKNEAKFVRRFAQSAEDADLVLIADTGSTDDTVDLARQCSVDVAEISVQPWRFDMARDTAMCLLPADVDVCISLDLDEVLEEGWRAEIERVWQPETTRLEYFFDWGCGIKFRYQKIHRRHGYRWHHPVHEYPKPDGRIAEVYARTEKLLVSHHPDSAKSRGQYLPLLRMAVKEDPQCPRNAFYFARELTFYNLHDEAIVALKKYLDMPNADWDTERCYAMRLLGKTYDALGNGYEALKWHRRATAEAPGTREPWVDLAQSCYLKAMWPEVLFAARAALDIPDKTLVYTCDPECWGWKPYDLAALGAHNTGDHAAALEYGELALAHAVPEQRARLEANVRWYERALQPILQEAA